VTGSNITFDTISPKQAAGPRVVVFTATPDEVAKIAKVYRIGRDAKHRLSGFQRPQIAGHIREIRDFLERPDAMLPNAIVLAFSKGAIVSRSGKLTIDLSKGPPGWVVDGQQRLTAALGMANRKFELIVSAFLCNDPAELNRQFILINNTRPLAKPLIYELLPSAGHLPERLSARVGAALLTEELNYNSSSSLRGLVHQQTNPDGVIKDTLLQKVLMNSIQQGALRNLKTDRLVSAGFKIVNEFFWAVQKSFAADWEGQTAKTSRLIHGAGLVSLGYVMDDLHLRTGATDRKAFEKGMKPLFGHTHWTKGTWTFGGERRGWSTIQNTAADYRLLSHYLVGLLRGRSGTTGRR
jgi:DGQHR domain-containing protein